MRYPKRPASLGAHHRPWPRARCGSVIPGLGIWGRDGQPQPLSPDQPEMREEQLLRHAQSGEMTPPRDPIGFGDVESDTLFLIVVPVGVALADKRDPDQVAQFLCFAIVRRAFATCGTRLRHSPWSLADGSERSRAWLPASGHPVR